jgi:hypothetical protein
MCAQIGRTIPAKAENWSANDMASVPLIANWPLRIMYQFNAGEHGAGEPERSESAYH